jgi:hypothetical protein
MKLFTTVVGPGWNAELPSNRLPSAYGHYARGYFNACIALLRHGGDDTLVYPAEFAFRHGLELALKSLARDFHVVGEAEELGKPNHPLGEIWEKVREPLEYYCGEFCFDSDTKLSPVDLDGVIYELDRSDAGSMAFRYPTSLDGRPYLGELPILNMAHFASTAVHVAEGVMVWVDWVAERAESRRFEDWKRGTGG